MTLKATENFVESQEDNILRLFDTLPNFLFNKSERKRD